MVVPTARGDGVAIDEENMQRMRQEQEENERVRLAAEEEERAHQDRIKNLE